MPATRPRAAAGDGLSVAERLLAEAAKKRPKYGNKRAYSALCGRAFDSIAERQRGEELRTLDLAGEIRHLEYQPKWTLCEDPRVTYACDFGYVVVGQLGWVYEDVKGYSGARRDQRVKLAWLWQRHGVTVRLLRKGRDGWEEVKL